MSAGAGRFIDYVVLTFGKFAHGARVRGRALCAMIVTSLQCIRTQVFTAAPARAMLPMSVIYRATHTSLPRIHTSSRSDAHSTHSHRRSAATAAHAQTHTSLPRIHTSLDLITSHLRTRHTFTRCTPSHLHGHTRHAFTFSPRHAAAPASPLKSPPSSGSGMEWNCARTRSMRLVAMTAFAALRRRWLSRYFLSAACAPGMAVVGASE